MRDSPPAAIVPVALRVGVGISCAGRSKIHGSAVEETPDGPLITEAAILDAAKAWLERCLGLVAEIEI